MNRNRQRFPRRPTRATERGRTRHEQQARRRRKRARAHLQKVSRRGPRIEVHQRLPMRLDGPRWKALAAVLAGGFVLAGVLGAQPLARAGLAWWHQVAPRIDRMAIAGHGRLSGSQVALASGIERGAEIAGLETSDIVDNLVAHDWIADAEVLLLPNGTALIGVAERQPRAILVATAGSQSTLVDAEGTPFASATAEDLAGPALVRLRTTQEPPRQLASPVLARAIALGEAIQALAVADLVRAELEIPSPRPASENGEPIGWILRSRDGGLEIRLGPDDGAGMATRLEHLQRLFAADLFEEPARGEVDLRFDGQAVLRTSLRPDEPGANSPIRPREEAGNTRRQGADASGRPQRGSPGEPAPLRGENHG